jgi:hypothetical protein
LNARIRSFLVPACVERESGYPMGRRFSMAVSTYENALQIAESLTPEEQRRLLRELTTRVAANTPDEPQHSIMELCGLGKEIWEGIDAQEYVRNERASWDG